MIFHCEPPQCMTDPRTGMPSDDLDPLAVKLISALGCSATTVSQVIVTQDKVVFAAIQQGINKANEEAESRPQKVVWFITCNSVRESNKYLLILTDSEIHTSESRLFLVRRRAW